MAISAIARLSLAAAVGTTLSLLATGEAFAYTFTKIAEFRDSFTNSFGPALNDKGTVAFWLYLNPEGTQEALFTGSGKQLTLIANSSDPLFRFFVASPEINNKNTVAFWGQLDAGGVGIFTSNGGSITTIADTTNSSFKGVGGLPAINNEGTVLFQASLKDDVGGGQGIFTSNGGAITTIDRTSDPNTAFAATLNNRGAVAYLKGELIDPIDPNFAEYSTILISNAGSTTTIADNSGPFSSFGSFSGNRFALNDENTVVFYANLDDGSQGIFTSNGGAITTIADTSNSFISFNRGLAINNKGTVAFSATLNTGTRGIFTGSDPVNDKVIAIGDPLFDSTVRSLSFFREGLNNSGQIAFYAQLADGTFGVYRAEPELQSVPEPASVLGLLAVSALGATSIRRKQKLG